MSDEENESKDLPTEAPKSKSEGRFSRFKDKVKRVVYRAEYREEPTEKSSGEKEQYERYARERARKEHPNPLISNLRNSFSNQTINRQIKQAKARRKEINGVVSDLNRGFYMGVKDSQNFYVVNSNFGYRSPYDRTPYIKGYGSHTSKLGKKVAHTDKVEIPNYTANEKRKMREALTNSNRREYEVQGGSSTFGNFGPMLGGIFASPPSESQQPSPQKAASKKANEAPQSNGFDLTSMFSGISSKFNFNNSKSQKKKKKGGFNNFGIPPAI